MCEPATIIAGASLAVGVASAGLGIASASAAQADREIQFEYQQQENERQYEYRQRQVDIAREREQRLEQRQEERIATNEEFARIAYGNTLAAIDVRQQQEQAKAAQEKTERAKKAMQAAGRVRARGQIGASAESLIADVLRQQAASDYYTSQNLAFAGDLFDQKRKDADVTLANNIGKESPYLRQTILDPMAPGRGVKPGKEAMYLSMGQSVLGGIQTGLTVDSSLKDMKAFGYKGQ